MIVACVAQFVRAAQETTALLQKECFITFQLVDYFQVYISLTLESFTNMETSQMPVKSANFGLLAKGNLYCATSTTTRDLGFLCSHLK
jgi:hypothetical protein